jgi:hypothetical protein
MQKSANYKLRTLLHDGKKHRIFHATDDSQDVVIKITEENSPMPKTKLKSTLKSTLDRKWANLTGLDVPLSENTLAVGLRSEFMLPKEVLQM